MAEYSDSGSVQPSSSGRELDTLRNVTHKEVNRKLKLSLNRRLPSRRAFDIVLSDIDATKTYKNHSDYKYSTDEGRLASLQLLIMQYKIKIHRCRGNGGELQTPSAKALWSNLVSHCASLLKSSRSDPKTAKNICERGSDVVIGRKRYRLLKTQVNEYNKEQDLPQYEPQNVIHTFTQVKEALRQYEQPPTDSMASDDSLARYMPFSADMGPAGHAGQSREAALSTSSSKETSRLENVVQFDTDINERTGLVDANANLPGDFAVPQAEGQIICGLPTEQPLAPMSNEFFRQQACEGGTQPGKGKQPERQVGLADAKNVVSRIFEGTREMSDQMHQHFNLSDHQHTPFDEEAHGPLRALYERVLGPRWQSVGSVLVKHHTFYFREMLAALSAAFIFGELNRPGRGQFLFRSDLSADDLLEFERYRLTENFREAIQPHIEQLEQELKHHYRQSEYDPWEPVWRSGSGRLVACVLDLLVQLHHCRDVQAFDFYWPQHGEAFDLATMKTFDGSQFSQNDKPKIVMAFTPSFNVCTQHETGQMHNVYKAEVKAISEADFNSSFPGETNRPQCQ